VRISQGTYDAVKEMSFRIEQRRFIDLKGKGMRIKRIWDDPLRFFENTERNEIPNDIME
jgi:hypothetical protein